MAQGYNMLYLSDDSDRPEGWGAIGNGQGPYFNKGAIRAIDYQTGKIAWEFPWGGKVGLLSTAGGVIFTGASGYTLALDAKTGHVLWRTAAAGTPSTGPVTFTLDGRQVVLVISGGSLYLFGL
jgi:alcohol dehydrogenase (cytochrome c)